jgi:predicted acylesterase/phospholipase RssA
MERSPILVDLALQGGGAHGAFTWGVLDRLLEESWLQIDGISGTSAGAMNAAVLADGYAAGGAAGARAALDGYWKAGPTPPASVRSSACRLTACWGAGRWILRRCSSAWT